MNEVGAYPATLGELCEHPEAWPTDPETGERRPFRLTGMQISYQVALLLDGVFCLRGWHGSERWSLRIPPESVHIDGLVFEPGDLRLSWTEEGNRARVPGADPAPAKR